MDPGKILLPQWLSKLYPFNPSRFATKDGAVMSYLDEGPKESEAVLMLHGNPTWSFYYRDLVQGLSQRRRCVVPDHVGMGLSEKPKGYPYTLERRISDIEALVAALGLRRIHLVVHDWGGAIGFGYAVRHPETIASLVILNTAAFVSDRIPGRIALCRNPIFGEFLVRGLNGFAGPAGWMASSKGLRSEVRKAYLFPYDSWANRIAVHRFVRDIPLEPGHGSRGTLEAIEQGLPSLAIHPKLILWGGRDFCFDACFLARWAAIYPGIRTELFPDAGHYILEDAGPDVRSRINAFIP